MVYNDKAEQFLGPDSLIYCTNENLLLALKITVRIYKRQCETLAMKSRGQVFCRLHMHL